VETIGVDIGDSLERVWMFVVLIVQRCR